jgi:hypothetical protein
VKEIVGGEGFLDPKNKFASRYIFIENWPTNAPSGFSASILLTSLIPPWLECYSVFCDILFSLLSDAKSPIFTF